MSDSGIQKDVMVLSDVCGATFGRFNFGYLRTYDSIRGAMSDGAVLDLVSRGKKDAYFIQGATTGLFGSKWGSRSPATREIRTEYPFSPARFGHWVDIDLPRVGDMLMTADIHIQMPTWLPSAIAALNLKHSVTIANPTASAAVPTGSVAYGWTNGIANFLIKRWALLLDNIELQQGWGEYNDWQPDSETTQMRAPLLHQCTGSHDGTDSSIARNATPPELVFRVPIVGCQGDDDTGLPLAAFRGQRLYVRLWLLTIEECVESGLLYNTPGPGPQYPVYQVCPAPWGGLPIYVDGVPVPEVTLPKHEVQHPILYGRYAVLHLDDEMKEELRSAEHAILYKQQLRQDFVVEAADLRAGSSIKQRLEITGLFQRLIFGFISLARLRQNKYRDINPTTTAEGLTGQWVANFSFIVNSQERVLPWPTKLYQDVAQNTQLRRDVERDLYFVVFGVSPDAEPAGALNLARTQKVLLSLDIVSNPVDPAIPVEQQAFGAVMGEAWNIMDIKGGVARLRFVD